MPGSADDGLLIGSLFADAAARHPERVAVVAGARSLSYAELDAAARRLAAVLRRAGAGPDVPVAVLFDRERVESVVAAVAVWLAGACYMPLDPAVPLARNRRMVASAEPVALIGVAEAVGPYADLAATVAVSGGRPPDAADGAIADALAPPAPTSQCPAPDDLTPDHLAYLVHTSGSTGEPKAVAVSHSALATIYRAWADCYDLVAAPRVCLQAAGPGFDVHVADLVRALLSGGRLVLCPTQTLLDPPALAALITAEQVDMIELTPAVLRLFVEGLDRSLPSLRLVISGGERWSVDAYRALRRAVGEQVRVVNSYGVAEAAIDSTWCEVTEHALAASGGSVPIGRPFPGVEVLVVDEAGRVVGEDGTGELWLAGPTLARGYHRKPELTAERFQEVFGRRWYRTGDTVRRVDGLLIHLGRGDDEVKVRGVRGSLSGVEAVLTSHPAVSGVAVLREEREGDAALVAHVVADPAALDGLRRHAADILPPALVPTLIAHRRLPLTASGKVDRAALETVVRAEPVIIARDGAEQLLVDLWARHLGRGPRDRQESLFEAGGSSLTAAKLAASLREATGAAISTATVLAAPTVAGLARELAEASAAAAPPRADTADVAPLSPDQRRLWLLHRLRPDDPAYHVPTVLRIEGPLRLDILRSALDRLVERHDAFRTAFADTPQGPLGRVLPPAGLPCELFEEPDEDTLAAFVSRPFDLRRGDVVRAAVLRRGPEHVELVLVAHHAVYDGWSERVVLEELGVIHDALLAGREPELPALPLRRLDVSRWQAGRLEGHLARTLRDYWRQSLAGAPVSLALPTHRPGTGTGRAGQVRASLTEQQTRAIAATAAAAGTTVNVVMLAAFAVLLGRWSGQSDLVVGVPYGDRDLQLTHGMVGFEVATLPIRLAFDPEEGFDALLDCVRRALTDAIFHSDLPFDQIADEARRSVGGAAPLFRVWFNWLGEPPQAPKLADMEVSVVDPPVPGALFDLGAYVTLTGPETRVDLVYDADLFDQPTIAAFGEQYVALLTGLCKDPARPPAEQHLAEEVVPPADLRGRAPDLLMRLAQVAAESADREAVRGAGRILDYRTLYARAAEVSRTVDPASVVGVLADRTTDLVPTLLGIIGAGAAFTVLDAGHPPARLAAQLDAAGARMALSAGPPVPRELATGSVRWLELPWKVASPGTGGAELAPTWPDAAVLPDALAYVAFTSGTTCAPRAVAGGLRPVAQFLSWYTARHDIGPGDRTAMLSGLAHDPLLREVFVPLWSGATLCVPPGELVRSPRELKGWLAAEEITVLHATPALCRLLALARNAPPLLRVRLVCCSGDTLTAGDVDAVRAWAPNAVVVHGYGTTETPQLVSARVLDPASPVGDPIPIDSAVPGAEVLVLDRRGRRTGVGELGDVVVRGPYLALGVLGEPSAFSADPVVGHRRFATGDLGRQTLDGRIALAGRRDEQAKVHGVRVEPAEIDRWLRLLPDAADAACAIRADSGGEPRVLAYLVPLPGHPAPPLEAVRARLRVQLPAPMLPVLVVAVESIPLTANGKVDRAALPEPAPPRLRPARPQGDLECLVADLWRAELRVEEVSVDRNFFDLGASSLQIARVHQQLEEALTRHIPITALFGHATVRTLAAHLDGSPPPSDTARRAAPSVSSTDLRLRRLAARGSASAKEKNR
ncbi:non-ribosomal peptide synthetase [Catellatospora chokoriensis]|uniref:Carrier domain-containing protein n=1 Tax=Catellatospora chokoriensis TaxID=310353 RepID=A0A8J3NPX7_9ACTN|nr:non-ribosomal peptide synthetase [Catellatospora chokoriensis]GIF87673.1 hypothetical protein Cch02nite_11170 [Catellatospora chokoriensis]